MEPVRRLIATATGIMSCLEWNHPGAECLLFAHANGFNALTYRTLLAPLAAKFHVVACDLRGHGRARLSAQPGLVKGWTIFRDDLLALAEALSERPVIFAGHSLGATASYMAAARSPERVRALVLLEPVLLAPISTGKGGNSNSLAEMAAHRRKVFPSFAAAVDYYRNRGIFARWPEQVLADYLTDGLTDDGDGALHLACAPDWEAEIFREVPFGIAAIADRVNCPVTIMRGTVASTAVDDQTAVILRASPHVAVITIEGANHFLPLEQPERAREELLRAAELL
ncbi:MAG TPA: alpha/beta hydrolase [Rhizomicrobium sp.]|nr:alpha/beta hydrolase [Rhizomicrobium sp.]